VIHITFWFMIIATLLSNTSSINGSQECPPSCIVEIQGLKAKYPVESTIKFVVHNLERKKIEVNVSAEALLPSGEWNEIVASISDKEHPYGKAMRLTPIQAGALLNVSYRPLGSRAQADRIKRAGIPITVRIAVDVFNREDGKIIQQVKSHPFELTH
jgi:hypothetical protein